MTQEMPNFAIMGSGGIGGYVGARLARSGFDTTFVAGGTHLQAIRDSGLRIEDHDETFSINGKATDDPQNVGHMDFVLFAVKLWDVAEAGAACRPLVGPDTAVVSLLNGVESEEMLTSILGADCVMGGVAEISATIAAPGVIKKVSPFALIRFGELDGRRSPRAQTLAAALSKAGISVDLSEDINLAIWNKFVFLTGLSAITAITRHPIGSVRADPDTRALLEEIMYEALRVGQAAGVPIKDTVVAERLQFIDGLPPDLRASMAIDLLSGRRLELPWLSGAVVRKGAKLGIATPANAFVCKALKLDVMGAPR
jgi:2-dehydropantoate 2-reductase